MFRIALMLSGLVIPQALAHGPDEPNAGWFNGLELPEGPMAGAKCCSMSDCKTVQTRYRGGHLEAFISSSTFPDVPNSPNEGHAPNDWVRVPEEAILHRHSNPTGEAVACWYNGLRCFVDGPET